MEVFLNLGLAWISVLLAVILSIIYLLRKGIMLTKGKNKSLLSINKALRKYHKALGCILVIVGLVHGLYSSNKVLSLNMGTVCWIASILLGLSWMFRKSLVNIKGWMYYHRILTVIFGFTIVLHVFDVGIHIDDIIKEKYLNLNGHRTEAAEEKYISPMGVDLNDGTYEGSARGYQSTITVEVEIKSNKIISVNIIGQNETRRYYEMASEDIPQAIIDNQTPEVDVVSGATLSSNGIIKAVKDAISKAVISE